MRNLGWATKFASGLAAVMAVMVFVPSTAAAFCGFYVGGAGAELFHDATQVVMMREGNQTVLSMQNRYQGPTDDFAMVVPVPQVLMKDNVKTLDDEIFSKIDTLTSPRLVEYWEQDPCMEPIQPEFDAATGGGGNNGARNDDNVTVEAEFEVGEYEIVVLSADESTSLQTWLTDNSYNIPNGADDYYQPYIDSGMYFFVAKVNSDKVTFEDGKAVLSPLRFDYESTEFQLPIRLGMINSAGQQDLLVYVLARNQRYELANYPNVTIPTNIEVINSVRNHFGTFYRSLFARTLKENPGAAVTEYSWNAATCDPCPGPVRLEPSDIETLGGDVLGSSDPDGFGYFDWVVTRLHLRYDKDEVGEDLVFKKADPIAGGRENYDEDGKLEKGAVSNSQNNFQARYIIRHHWEGPVECTDPDYGRWGGNPEEGGGMNPGITSATSPNTSGEAVFPQGDATEVDVEEEVQEDIPEINVKARPGDKGSGGCSSTDLGSTIPAGIMVLLGFVGLGVIRRRRRS